MCQCMIQVRQLPVLLVLDLSSASPSSPSFNGFLTTLWSKGRVQAYHLFPIRTHSQEKECALAVQSYSEPKWSHFVEIKDEGTGLNAWFRHVAVVAVVRAPIPWLSTVSEASQLSEGNKDIPALCLFPLVYFSNDCAQSHWLASNLIFEKKEEIDAFESSHWDCAKVILKQEELPRVRHFLDQCCLIKLIKIDAVLWEHVPTGGGRVIKHRVGWGFFITHLCRFRVASSQSWLCPPLISNNP